jgi:hypothetical protein
MEETDIALLELLKRGSLFWKNLDEQERYSKGLCAQTEACEAAFPNLEAIFTL